MIDLYNMAVSYFETDLGWITEIYFLDFHFHPLYKYFHAVYVSPQTLPGNLYLIVSDSE